MLPPTQPPRTLLQILNLEHKKKFVSKQMGGQIARPLFVDKGGV